MRHAFVDSGETRTDARGRTLRLCAECGRVNLGVGHMPTPKPVPTPEPLHSPIARAMIELAIAGNIAMLEHTDVTWTTRVRVVEANRLLRQEITPEVSDLQIPQERTPLTGRVINANEQRAKVASRGINDPKMRAIATRAIEQGWMLRKTGDHWALDRGGETPIVFATTSSDKRAWRNMRATAKRRGINVEGI